LAIAGGAPEWVDSHEPKQNSFQNAMEIKIADFPASADRTSGVKLPMEFAHAESPSELGRLIPFLHKRERHNRASVCTNSIRVTIG